MRSSTPRSGQYPRAVRNPERTNLWRRGFPAVLYLSSNTGWFRGVTFFNRAYPELRKRYRAALTSELTPGPQDVNPSFFKSENTLTAEKAWRHWRKVVDGARDGKLLPGAVTEIATVDELAPRKGKSNERPAGPTYQIAPATLRRERKAWSWLEQPSQSLPD